MYLWSGKWTKKSTLDGENTAQHKMQRLFNKEKVLKFRLTDFTKFSADKENPILNKQLKV